MLDKDFYLELCSPEFSENEERSDYTWITIDCTGLKTNLDLYFAFKKYFHFPAYFGENLDAFYDVLAEYDIEKKPISILFTNTAHWLTEESTENKENMLFCLSDIGQNWVDILDDDELVHIRFTYSESMFELLENAGIDYAEIG